MSFETNGDEWAEARAGAQVFLHKPPESPLATIATEHEDYWMAWLDAHQFHPWGYNVQILIDTPGWLP